MIEEIPEDLYMPGMGMVVRTVNMLVRAENVRLKAAKEGGAPPKDLPANIRVLKNGNVMRDGKMLTREARRELGL